MKTYGFVAPVGVPKEDQKEENAIGIKIAAKVAKNQCGPKGRIARFNLITVGKTLGPDNDKWILDFALDAKPAIVIKVGAFCHLRGSDEKWYAKDFAKADDYDAVCKAVRKAMDDELSHRFEGFVLDETPTAVDAEDEGDEDTGPNAGSLTDAELEAFEKELED